MCILVLGDLLVRKGKQRALQRQEGGETGSSDDFFKAMPIAQIEGTPVPGSSNVNRYVTVCHFYFSKPDRLTQKSGSTTVPV